VDGYRTCPCVVNIEEGPDAIIFAHGMRKESRRHTCALGAGALWCVFGKSPILEADDSKQEVVCVPVSAPMADGILGGKKLLSPPIPLYTKGSLTPEQGGLSTDQVDAYRDMAVQIVDDQWNKIQSSKGHRWMIRDFKSNDHPSVRRLFNAIHTEYIPRLLEAVQVHYPTLKYYEFNVLRTLKGISRKQRIHLDVKRGTYALSMIIAWDTFVFDHCFEKERISDVVTFPEAVMFSGGCLHGGGATDYPSDTYRLFVVFTRSESELPGDKTYFPEPDAPHLSPEDAS
jgi:hypothetical protein